MKYIMEIRDLSNEANELKNLRTDVQKNCDVRNKQIEIMASNHARAIASYLEHVAMEIDKLGVNQFIACCDGNSINFNKGHFGDGYYLWINVDGSNAHKYILKDGTLMFGFCWDIPLNNNKAAFEHLMVHWNELKKSIDSTITELVESEMKKQMKKENENDSRLHLYQNFEI